MNEQWSSGCQSSVYATTLNGTVLISSFITGTTSAPSCLAAQLIKAKVPLMKSFWTSTITNAVRGWSVFFFLFNEI